VQVCSLFTTHLVQSATLLAIFSMRETSKAAIPPRSAKLQNSWSNSPSPSSPPPCTAKTLKTSKATYHWPPYRHNHVPHRLPPRRRLGSPHMVIPPLLHLGRRLVPYARVRGVWMFRRRTVLVLAHARRATRTDGRASITVQVLDRSL